MPRGPRNLPVSFSGASLTHFGGLVLLHQFVQQLGLRSRLAQAVRFSQRNNRYSTTEAILALVYPIILGLGRIETTQLLRRNGVFQYLTGLPAYPDPQTLRRFLGRFAEAGLSDFLAMHDRLRQQWIGYPETLSTAIFDFDSTVLTVYGHQDRAMVGFNPKNRGRPSYLPLLCVEGQTGDCWAAEYHPGNMHVATVIIPFWEAARTKVPPTVRTVRFRADSAFYTREIVEALEAHRAGYTIVARMTRRLQQPVAAVRYQPVGGRVDLAELPYQPQGWPGPRRFVAIRRPVPEEPSWQLSLFRMGKYVYRVIVTNLELTPLHIWRFYNARAEAELVIREMKEAYALGKLPTGDWEANSAYFQLVVFAYNLLNWFRRFCLPEPWQRLTLPTIRNRLLVIPAELVRPQEKPVLKLPQSFPYQQEFFAISEQIKHLKLP
jgi:Transposase DDE domain group 1